MDSIDTTLASKCLICEPFFMAVEYEGHPISSDNGLISQKLLL